MDSNADFYILELSSYQIERTLNVACNIAVLLNITPDHIEYHNNFKQYINCKKRLLLESTAQIIDDNFQFDTNFIKRIPTS